MVFLVFSCTSSHSSNDSDILPDSDADAEEVENPDDDSDSQTYEIVDDFEEILDADTDSDTEDPVPDDEEPNEPTEEIFEETEPINGYARCYDKIPAGSYEGFFADKKIESQIKKNLGYDSDHELTEEDLGKITEIIVDLSKDIRGVEKLVNLEYVVILTGKIYDYTPLSQLKKLKKLRIHAESMTCLDGSFSLLTNLETFEIEGTKLKDVSPVEQLVNLTSLMVHNNQIESLPKNLGHLQKLEYLALSYNNIRSVDLVNSLTRLKELYFHYNYIEDISPVKDLVNLTSLGAQGNRIKDISAVTKLVNLTWLGLDENQIERIPKDFVNLKKLKTCQLLYNNISNLPNLKGLDSLVEMRISSNDLTDEDFMKFDDLENVQFLHVPLCKKITKVPVMKNLKSLKELYLNYNYITDLSGFADNESFPALKSVYLGSNKITDAEALRKREGLNRLSIGKNCIQDLSPLEELKERGTYISGMNEQLESCDDTSE
ncbi:leucine-rich repeat domain-containing protein [bacterium]|nr:leucine-rich repeat domain-containing protein [bacterium]